MTPEARARLFVGDMAHHSELALDLVAGLTEDAFRSNVEKQLAATRASEISGAAAKSVPETIRALGPDIPWRQIIGTRDKLIHHYFGTDLGLVWQVTQSDLPILLGQHRTLQTQM